MINVAGILEDSIVDGPGIRTVIFCQGCPHHCPGCHNPETWEFGIGRNMKVESIYRGIRFNPMVRGVTFSGGEPFSQPEGFRELAFLLKQDGYEVASYTGYTFEQLIKGSRAQRALLSLVDILIDGRFEEEKRSLRLAFRGSENQRILNVPESLAKGYAVETEQKRWYGEYDI